MDFALPYQLGPYRLAAMLGRGATSRVYRAEQRLNWSGEMPIQRDVAIKLLEVELLRDKPQVLKRFYQEARIEAMLAHPHIITVYEMGEIQEIPYYTMELAERSLCDILFGEDDLSFPQKIQIFWEVADALCLAHTNNIVHRDLKPQNILLDSTDHPKLMDFGIAQAHDDSLLGKGKLLGTIDYMAPEQTLPENAVSPKTDVFTLGAVMYHVFARVYPFPNEDREEMLRQRREMLVPEVNLTLLPLPLDQVIPSFPKPLSQLIGQCLHPDPQQRPEAQAVRRQLSLAIDD